ncbi:MAG: thiamine pyrophosphate-binding protein [Pseudomonadota bacterium]
MAHGGRSLVQQLEAQGVSTIFTVPGESFLAALDGFHEADGIQTIICRQEGGAAMMAEAWGKFTGRPGICFVTRGPGAANAMSGLHVAQQDSTPMVLFLGMPASDHEDREAFQEVDVGGLFGTFVKWAAVIRDSKRIPEYVSRAFHVAQSGRPGPVVLGLPEDMLAGASGTDVVAPAARPAAAAPQPTAMRELQTRLSSAERPLIVVGGPGWSAETRDRLQDFATRTQIPVASAFRCQDYVDNRNQNYVGCVGIGVEPELADAVRSADVLLTIGARFGEMTSSGYTLLDIPQPKQTLVHVHPDPSELGTVYRSDIPIAASADEFVSALSELDVQARPGAAERVQRLRDVFLASLKPLGVPGDVKLDHVIAKLSDLLPDDAVVCNGAGNYAAFLHRYYAYKGWRTQVAPTSGSMGYGLPAAIAAKIATPDRPVIALAGDGCFMMTCQELATAAQYGANVVTIVVNNGIYGTIRMHQERDYPQRVIATELKNPDFAAFAQCFGAHGETVTRTDDFGAALDRALSANAPAIIELKTDPEAISPKQTISGLRSRA